MTNMRMTDDSDQPQTLICPVCGSEYDLDDGIDWGACTAHYMEIGDFD